jgi:hypothetical protein
LDSRREILQLKIVEVSGEPGERHLSGVRTLAGCADTSKHGRVRFVIALGGNSGAMRFRLLKAIESVDNHPARSKSLRCPLRVTNGHLASEALSVLCRTGRAKKCKPAPHLLVFWVPPSVATLNSVSIATCIALLHPQR